MDDGESSGNAGQQKSLDVLGSGFIVAPTGIVLTNKHVVEGEKSLVVQTADGKQFPVVQVRTDREQDAAVLRIDAKTPLPFVRLGNSDAAEIGDWVLTIGSPLELEQTVSAGIISAKNRSFCSKHPTQILADGRRGQSRQFGRTAGGAQWRRDRNHLIHCLG